MEAIECCENISNESGRELVKMVIGLMMQLAAIHLHEFGYILSPNTAPEWPRYD